MTVTDGSRCDDDRLCSSLSLIGLCQPLAASHSSIRSSRSGCSGTHHFLISCSLPAAACVQALLTFSFVVENVNKGTCSNCIHTHCCYINPWQIYDRCWPDICRRVGIVLLLCRAAFLLSLLNAFSASTNKRPSVSSFPNIFRMAWIDTLIPDFRPAHV